MVTQVVEIAEDGNHLSKYRGFMAVKRGGQEVARVPLDDITALILSAHQVTFSKALIMELSDRGTPVITCGRNYHPLAFTLPYDTHHDQTGILWMQIDCSKPLAKRLWQSIVREKVQNQKIALEYFEPDSPILRELEILKRRVRSGDPENMEAQAARYYWKALMGEDFKRDRYEAGANSMLNYAYSILRAATARAVCGTGLTPAIGLHHRNRKNAYALVDDMMEPYRPIVDMTVKQIIIEGGLLPDELTPDIKKDLARILDQDVQIERGVTSVMNSLHRLSRSLVLSLETRENKLAFPMLKPRGLLV